MYKKSLYVVLFSIFLGISWAYADKPPEGEGWNYISKEKRTVSGYSLSLIPEFSGRAVLLDEVSRDRPKTSMEVLYKMPLPDRQTGNDPVLLFIFNSLNRISGMEGILYYSARKKSMVPYLTKSYVVKKPGSKVPLKDPVFQELPEKASFKIYQKDTTFGSNWYNVNLTVYRDSVHFSMTNSRKMKYMFIPILGEGEVSIDFVVVLKENCLIFYVLTRFDREKHVKVLGQDVYLPGFFDHRVSALQGWFAREIYRKPVPGMIAQ